MLTTSPAPQSPCPARAPSPCPRVPQQQDPKWALPMSHCWWGTVPTLWGSPLSWHCPTEASQVSGRELSPDKSAGNLAQAPVPLAQGSFQPGRPAACCLCLLLPAASRVVAACRPHPSCWQVSHEPAPCLSFPAVQGARGMPWPHPRAEPPWHFLPLTSGKWLCQGTMSVTWFNVTESFPDLQSLRVWKAQADESSIWLHIFTLVLGFCFILNKQTAWR